MKISRVHQQYPVLVLFAILLLATLACTFGALSDVGANTPDNAPDRTDLATGDEAAAFTEDDLVDVCALLSDADLAAAFGEPISRLPSGHSGLNQGLDWGYLTTWVCNLQRSSGGEKHFFQVGQYVSAEKAQQAFVDITTMDNPSADAAGPWQEGHWTALGPLRVLHDRYTINVGVYPTSEPANQDIMLEIATMLVERLP